MTSPRYLFRTITAEQATEVRKALAAGVRAVDLAAEYNVNVRTIYRARERAYEPTATVTVGDWTTRYALTDEGPVQLQPWRPTAEAIA